MPPLTYRIQVRWADIDANRHLRHSAYYDFGATMRFAMLTERGISAAKLEELQIGPVLFREEAIFRREIRFEDPITLTMELTRATADYSRWSIRHHFLKADNTLAAIVNIDGAWIDLVKRKLARPDALIQEAFGTFPRSVDFSSMDGQKS